MSHNFGMGVGTPSAGAVGMTRVGSGGIGLSGSGIPGGGINEMASIMNSDRELFAKGKIREIVDLFKDEWGHVSRIGVQKVAERLKLDTLWETAEDAEPAILNIAGLGLLIVVTFSGWQVTDVNLGFPVDDNHAAHETEEEGRRGTAILQKDLQGWDNEQETGKYVKLQRFGQNMEYLAALDNLGKNSVSCFEAIDGIYRSLKRVEAWWEKRPGESGRYDMLIRGPGWPRMHANAKVGLVLDYWLHRWQGKSKAKPKDYLVSPTSIDSDLYSIRIGVGATDPAIMAEPIRVSSDWFEFLDDMPVDGEIELAIGKHFPPLELKMKNPEPSYLPYADGSDSNFMEVDGQQPQKPLPEVLFKAHLEPPLPIGYAAAVQFLQGRLGMLQQHSIVMTSYDDLALPAIDSELNGSTRKRATSTGKSNNEIVMDTAPLLLESRSSCPLHEKGSLRYSLTGTQSIVAVTATEFAFDHPMDLLSALPMLRMWAWLHALFRQSFVRNATPRPKAQAERDRGRNKNKKPLSAKEYRALLKAGKPIPSQDAETELDDQVDKLALASEELIDIEMEVSNEFPNHVHLDITIPMGEDNDPVSAQFVVQPGPEVLPRDASIDDPWAKAMAKVLLLGSDFGSLVAWARLRQKEGGRASHKPVS